MFYRYNSMKYVKFFFNNLYISICSIQNKNYIDLQNHI